MSRTSRLHLDPDALRSTAARLHQVGEQYDASAAAAPLAGVGATAPLVALVLSSYLEAAALIVSEVRVLGVAVDAARTDVEIADSQSALDLFRVTNPAESLAS